MNIKSTETTTATKSDKHVAMPVKESPKEAQPIDHAQQIEDIKKQWESLTDEERAYISGITNRLIEQNKGRNK